jgi:hypothetical protein
LSGKETRSSSGKQLCQLGNLHGDVHGAAGRMSIRRIHSRHAQGAAHMCAPSAASAQQSSSTFPSMHMQLQACCMYVHAVCADHVHSSPAHACYSTAGRSLSRAASSCRTSCASCASRTCSTRRTPSATHCAPGPWPTCRPPQW